MGRVGGSFLGCFFSFIKLSVEENSIVKFFDSYKILNMEMIVLLYKVFVLVLNNEINF